MKAQGSTEYLVTLGVILFLGIIVSVVLFWPVGSTKDVKQSQSDIKYKIQAMNPASLKTGLVAYYKFDEGSGTIAYDFMGAYNGNLTNGPTWTSGKSNSGIDFDGANDFVDVNISLGTTHSVSLWIKPDVLDKVFLGSAADTYALYIQPAGTVHYYLNGPSASASGGIITGEWQHVVVARNGTTVTFYVNGVNKGSGTLSSSPAFTLRYIGKENSGDSWAANGIIDEVLIYNRALSPSEVELLYTVPNVLKSDTIFNTGTP